MAIYRSAMWEFLKGLFREDDLKYDTLYHFSLEFYVLLFKIKSKSFYLKRKVLYFNLSFSNVLSV